MAGQHNWSIKVRVQKKSPISILEVGETWCKRKSETYWFRFYQSGNSSFFRKNHWQVFSGVQGLLAQTSATVIRIEVFQWLILENSPTLFPSLFAFWTLICGNVLRKSPACLTQSSTHSSSHCKNPNVFFVCCCDEIDTKFIAFEVSQLFCFRIHQRLHASG